MLPSSYLTYQYRNSRSPRVKRSSETRHATKTLTQDHFLIITSNKSLDSFKRFSWTFAEKWFENESKLYDNMPTKAFDYMMLMVTLEAVFENTQVRTQKLLTVRNPDSRNKIWIHPSEPYLRAYARIWGHLERWNQKTWITWQSITWLQLFRYKQRKFYFSEMISQDETISKTIKCK